MRKHALVVLAAISVTAIAFAGRPPSEVISTSCPPG